MVLSLFGGLSFTANAEFVCPEGHGGLEDWGDGLWFCPECSITYNVDELTGGTQYLCPNGHGGLEDWGDGLWFCPACGITYNVDELTGGTHEEHHYLCPAGHDGLQDEGGGWWYCPTCSLGYDESQLIEYTPHYVCPAGHDGLEDGGGGNWYCITCGTLYSVDRLIDTSVAFRVTWVDYDGSILETDDVYSNDTPSYDGDTPERLADTYYTYTFAGWSPEVVAVTGNATYAATYTETLKTGLTAATLLEEGFDETADGALPTGWTTDGGANWQLNWQVLTADSLYDEFSSYGAILSGRFVFSYQNDSNGTASLLTPVCDLSDADVALLRFAYINRNYEGDTDGLYVDCCVNGGDWQNIFSATDAHGAWQQMKIVLPAAALTENVQLRFRNASRFGHGILLDNIKLEALTAAGSYDQFLADEAIDLINAIGTVECTDECRDRITAARAAYDALTAAQKALIDEETLAVLTDAEAAYAAALAATATTGHIGTDFDNLTPEDVKELADVLYVLAGEYYDKDDGDGSAALYGASDSLRQAFIMANDSVTDEVTACYNDAYSVFEEHGGGLAAADFDWMLDREGTLTITGSGTLTQFKTEALRNDDVKKVVFTEGCGDVAVTAAAFARFNNVAQVVINSTAGVFLGHNAFTNGGRALTVTITAPKILLIGEAPFYNYCEDQTYTLNGKVVAAKGIMSFADSNVTVAISGEAFFAELAGAVFSGPRADVYQADYNNAVSENNINRAAELIDRAIENGCTVILPEPETPITALNASEAFDDAVVTITAPAVDPDPEAADAVIALIEAIGDVTYTAESQQKILAARNAYNALTAEQQALVTNYATLAAAEAAYAALTIGITTQPVNCTAEAGGRAAFSVEASSDYDLTYLWQYTKDGGVTWKDSTAASARTPNLNIAANGVNAGLTYHCLISNPYGTVTTDEVHLILIEAAPEIDTQPTDAEVILGDRAHFSVTASGYDLTYRWQYSKDGGETWKNSRGTGAKTAHLEIAGSLENAKLLYRCVVGNLGGVEVTDTVRVIVTIPAPVIDTQPVNADVAEGDRARFSVTASGYGLTYQWKYSLNGGKTWINSTGKGAKTANLEIAGSLANARLLYHCVITNKGGTVITDEVHVNVADTKPVLIRRPVNAVAAEGDRAYFHVLASGEDVTYQWQYSPNNGRTWYDSTGNGADTPDLDIAGSEANAKLKYRCVITNDYGSVTTAKVRVVLE